jgi:hypothetical protein
VFARIAATDTLKVVGQTLITQTNHILAPLAATKSVRASTQLVRLTSYLELVWAAFSAVLVWGTGFLQLKGAPGTAALTIPLE